MLAVSPRSLYSGDQLQHFGSVYSVQRVEKLAKFVRVHVAGQRQPLKFLDGDTVLVAA